MTRRLDVIGHGGGPRSAAAPEADRSDADPWPTGPPYTDPSDVEETEAADDRPLGRRGGSRLPGARQVRLDPGRPGALLLCLVAVLSAALAAGVAWASRPSLEPVAAAPIVTSGTVAPSTGAPAAPAELVVAVVGQVATPGLVRLPAGSRVADAVAAAGGALPDADLTTINLARILTDGEQVAVGVPGAPAPPGAAPGDDAAAQVNLNTASESELEELPGVGPVLAGRIVQWRTDNGPFTSVEQLEEVDGIGPSTFEELRDQVTR